MNRVEKETEIPQRKKKWRIAIAETQQQAIRDGQKILENILRRGISSIDVEYCEEICYDVEGLIDYLAPNFLKSFRHFFSLLYHVKDPEKQSVLIAQTNYLLAVCGQGSDYLKSIAGGAEPDANALVEAHLGHLWKNLDLLQYKMFEKDAEIIQLSFNSTKDEEKMAFFDKGYWFNLKTGKINYTCRIRPDKAERFIKEDDTEFDVLQPEKLFVYPGKLNCRIRWGKTEKRKVTPKDIETILKSAETNYTKVINQIKENFRDPLTERNPAVLIKLHKTFIYGDYLVLEDEQGGMLTVADLSEDSDPTVELLQAILPAQPTGYALLVEVNDDIQTRLFSVKPLSIIASDGIIRLLY